jgi:hypothetical protein
MRIRAALLLVVAFTTPTRSDDAKDSDHLQGTWKLVAVTPYASSRFSRCSTSSALGPLCGSVRGTGCLAMELSRLLFTLRSNGSTSLRSFGRNRRPAILQGL